VDAGAVHGQFNLAAACLRRIRFALRALSLRLVPRREVNNGVRELRHGVCEVANLVAQVIEFAVSNGASASSPLFTTPHVSRDSRGIFG
jgi:hypothetical protein